MLLFQGNFVIPGTNSWMIYNYKNHLNDIWKNDLNEAEFGPLWRWRRGQKEIFFSNISQAMKVHRVIFVAPGGGSHWTHIRVFVSWWWRHCATCRHLDRSFCLSLCAPNTHSFECPLCGPRYLVMDTFPRTTPLSSISRFLYIPIYTYIRIPRVYTQYKVCFLTPDFRVPCSAFFSSLFYRYTYIRYFTSSPSLGTVFFLSCPSAQQTRRNNFPNKIDHSSPILE